MASFGIIYASGSKMVRRIIANSTNLGAHIGVGEDLLVVQQDLCPNVFEAQDHVEKATGIKPANFQCAVVDETGIIKSVILADPAIDGVDQHKLIPLYEGVTQDCVFDAKSELFVAPPRIVKAGEKLTREGPVLTEDVVVDAGGPIARPNLNADAVIVPLNEIVSP